VHAQQHSVKIHEVKKVELEGEVDESSVVIGEFTTPFSV
jgi:hypothetical protein